jgi:hypothetical protein
VNPPRSFYRGPAFALALWTFIAWGAAAAAGAPSVQSVSDRTAAELTRILGVPVEPRGVLVTDEMYHPNANGEFWATEPERYRLRPWVAVAARGGWLYDHEYHGGRPRMLGLEIVAHELLHRADNQRCWGTWAGGVNVEEGIVDALTADLTPALAWRIHRERVVVAPTYPADASAIRAASRFATGSPSWRTAAARYWRRALWRADCDGRRAMLAAATEAARA